MNSRGSKGVDDPEVSALPNSIEASYVHYNDYYLSELSQNVVIRCGPKAVHVEVVLSEPVQVEDSSNWSEFIQSFMGRYNIMAMVDSLGRAVSGVSLRQPWMSRKIWQGSTLVRLSLNLKFLVNDGTFVRGGKEVFLGADNAGFIEVYQPTCQLMSLIYPCEIGDGETMSHFVSPGSSAFHVFKGDDSLKGQGDSGNDSMVGIPVDVQVGNFILFQNCFVTNCSIQYSPLLDPSGYPMSATASLTVESYEYPFVDMMAAKAIRFWLFKRRDSPSVHVI
jgi:hypothetical protein